PDMGNNLRCRRRGLPAAGRYQAAGGVRRQRRELCRTGSRLRAGEARCPRQDRMRGPDTADRRNRLARRSQRADGAVMKAARQFVPLPRELLETAAWRSLGINARRLLDFLMVEHMRHGGKRNGYLLAPRRQLAEFGI